MSKWTYRIDRENRCVERLNKNGEQVGSLTFWQVQRQEWDLIHMDPKGEKRAVYRVARDQLIDEGLIDG